MPTALYDEIYSVPQARKRRRPVPLGRSNDELEFSEYGRSSAIPAGWYLLPGLVITATLMALL
jgi:hypothetical protein